MTLCDAGQSAPGPISDDDLRGQVCALVTALGEHTRLMKPLVTVAPALVEMANAYSASKGGVTWLGKTSIRAARWLGIAAAWAVRVGAGAVMVWGVVHARWDIIAGSAKS